MLFLTQLLIFLSLFNFSSGQASGNRKIKNWEAEIDFNAKIEKHYADVRKVAPPSKIHDFLEQFTFRKESSFTQQDLKVEAADAQLRSRAGSIQQDFDHFGDSKESDGKKWTQHFYYISNQNSSLPTSELNFLMLEGEGGFSESWIGSSWAFVHWAKDFGATAYTLEHRFYGDSELNSGDVTLDRLNLLSSEQALADAAVFIQNVNRQQNFTNPKWISFGGSYPGNLAAWLRLKYPELVYGSIASSAPVLAELDFYQYMQVVQDSFERYGFEGCSDAIVKFFGVAEQMLETPEGREKLRVCEPLEGKSLSKLDKQLFVSGHLGSMSYAVQYDDAKHQKLNKTCNYFKGWIDWLDQLERNSSLKSGACTSYDFRSDMAYFNNSKSLTYYWYWQTCNEFGYFQSSSQGRSSFSVTEDALPADFFVAMCQEIFGKQFDRALTEDHVKNTNEIFGGVDNFNGTNIVFLNGSEDPWHTLSILSDRPGDIRTYLINGTSHCYDMYTLNSWSTQGHVDAHELAKSQLKKWLL